MNSEAKLIAKKQEMQKQSAEILDIINNEPQSALRCIHLVSVAGGATNQTYKAIQERVLEDEDTFGAYHLALMAQSTPDLPIDARKLIEMVTLKGDNDQLLSLLKNLPIPPVELIQQRIIDSGDEQAIAKLKEYLEGNPDGIGSEVMLGSGQKNHIIPLSEAE